jgi:hypothetical protein
MNIIKFLLTIGILFFLSSIYSMQVSMLYEKEALHNLIDGNLQAFDALVGDTACHIRALYIAMLYDKLQAAQVSTDRVTQDELDFATLSFMLTKTKEVNYSDLGSIIVEKTNYKLLDPTLSKAKGDLLIKKAQTKLAELSVNFLQEQAKLFNDTGLQQALSIVLIDDHIFKRKTIACYPSLKLIFLCMIAQERPLIIKLTRPCSECSSKRHVMGFFYKPIDGIFTFCTPEQGDLNRAALVIEGFCELRQLCREFQHFCFKFQEYSIFDIILANAAAHPQFAGKNNQDETVLNLQEELTFYTRFAQTHGCCNKNPALFCIDHISCKTVKQALII